jgi:hypothetical protein
MTASRHRPTPTLPASPVRVPAAVRQPGFERSLALPWRLVIALSLVAGCVLSAPSGFGLLWFAPYAGVGALLAIRRPSSPIGWLLMALGWAFALVTLTLDATPDQFAAGTLAPHVAILASVTANQGTLGFFLLALLAIVFPSGRFPTGRWGAVARIAAGIALACVLVGFVMPRINVNLWSGSTGTVVRNPLAILPDLPVWAPLTPDTVVLPVVALMGAAIVSLFLRFRRAVGVERQQLKWIAAALGFVVVAVFGGFVTGILVPAAAQSGVVWLGAVVAFPCVPVAIGLAVLRYRLYEIDRLVSRTIGWALTTGTIAALFGALAVGLQGLLAPLTAGNGLAVAASTLTAVALFQPLRRRLQRVVDRRFNRARYDAERTVADFAARLRDQIELRAIQAHVLASVDAAVRPAGTTLWLRERRR